MLRVRLETHVPPSRYLDMERVDILRLEGLRRLAGGRNASNTHERAPPCRSEAKVAIRDTVTTDAVGRQDAFRMCFWLPVYI
jgi:hypothetical protein